MKNHPRFSFRLLRLWERALFWVFPRRCAWCGGVTEAAYALCPACEAKCAGESETQERQAGENRGGVPVVSCYFYRSAARRQFFALKFNGKRGLAPSIGRTMAEALLAANLARVPELICFVPMTRRQLQDRGYNQSQLLARAVARHLELPLAPSLLLKTRETGKQHGLPARQRENNVAGAFAAGESDMIRGRRILLCDDVVTTGSTLQVCVGALLAAGAAEVVCLTFLRTTRKYERVWADKQSVATV